MIHATVDYRKLAEAALERRATVFESIKEIDSDTALTDAEKRERIERADAEMAQLEGEARGYIERAERETEVRTLTERAGALGVATSGEAPKVQGDDVEKLLRNIASGEAREGIFKATRDELRALERRAASLTTTSANAGVTVPTTFVAQVIESLRFASPIFDISRVISTDSGEPMDFPKRLTHTSPAPGVVAEGTVIPSGNGTLDKFTLHASKYGVLTQASVEMIEDSGIDIAPFIADDAGVELGRSVSTAFVTALLAAITVSTAPAAGVTGDALIGLYHAIVDGYRGNGVWVMNDSTVATIRTWKDAYGQYLWQPGLSAGAPDTLIGRPLRTDYNVPNNEVMFGDFKRGHWIRQVNALRVVRSDEYGFDSDLVTFKVTWRGDAGLADENAIAKMTLS